MALQDILKVPNLAFYGSERWKSSFEEANGKTQVSVEYRRGSTVSRLKFRRQTSEEKWRYWELLVKLGFKQIEIGFPIASDIEYDFMRDLINTPGAIPDDVTVQALSPCRKDALERSVDALRGAKKAILFTYIASSDNYRETIYGMTENECINRINDCVRFAKSITVDKDSASETEWTFGFGCEDAGDARPDLLLRIGETVKSAWGPTVERPLIFGMATSVESITPNVFADLVEYISTNVTEREKIILSVHPHNDRGCAVAAAELACLAGAEEVEGCLFGNGERAGNVDLITLAGNMLRQGIDPGIDLSLLPEARRVVEEITAIPVHSRAPYAGDFAFLALSGGHQDAIRKGFALRDQGSTPKTGEITNGGADNLPGPNDVCEQPWRVPYLPLDPADVGVTQAELIGINSQSGKGGILWILQNELGFRLPRSFALEFSQYIKKRSAKLDRHFDAGEICSMYLDRYCQKNVSNGDDLHYEDLSTRCHESNKCLNNFEAAREYVTHLRDLDVQDREHSCHVIQRTGKYAAYTYAGQGDADGRWGFGVGQSVREAYVRALLSSLTVSLQVT